MANVKVLNEGSITVGFDTEITEELLFEGIARDVVRCVQTRRKDSGLEVSDHIRLSIAAEGDAARAVEAFRDYICNETLADELVISENDGEAVEIGEEQIRLSVSRV